MNAETLLCHRCGGDLEPGQGDWYVVHIQAYADPTPPHIRDEDLQQDIKGEMARLVEQMRQGGTSEQELVDQVHRRLTLHLCGRCYRRWIENPTAGPKE